MIAKSSSDLKGATEDSGVVVFAIDSDAAGSSGRAWPLRNLHNRGR